MMKFIRVLTPDSTPILERNSARSFAVGVATTLALTLLLSACNTKPAKLDAAGLDKYPQCYSKNLKLSKACISENEAGKNVTAMQLENEAYPGQYK